MAGTRTLFFIEDLTRAVLLEGGFKAFWGNSYPMALPLSDGRCAYRMAYITGAAIERALRNLERASV